MHVAYESYSAKIPVKSLGDVRIGVRSPNDPLCIPQLMEAEVFEPTHEETTTNGLTGAKIPAATQSLLHRLRDRLKLCIDHCKLCECHETRATHRIGSFVQSTR